MAEMNKIQSFKTFSQLKAEEKEIQLQEEAKGKREQLVTKIGETLAEMDITSFDELSEEQKKALVAKLFNEEIKEVEAEEVEAEKSVEEGNAFIFAAAKAKQAGESEFEFKGKTYKVTLKADVGLKESYNLLITEGTRWQFGIIDKTGKIESNYVHFDGYPSSVIPQIKDMDAKQVRSILKDSEMGGMSSLDKPYNDSQESTITTGTVKNIKKYLKDIENSAGAEYVYLFDEKSGKWVGADTYVDKDLKPVDQIEESVVTEANYSLSKLEDMGFKAGEDYFEKVKGLLKNGPDLKAYEKGFTQGFVDNAAAYGVKESVVTEAKGFKNTEDFEAFLKEIDSMPENHIRKIMGKDYIDTPGFYEDEKDDYEDVIDFMMSNMGRKDFNELKDWWESNVQESVVTEASKMDKEFKAMYAAIKEHDLLMKIAKDLFPKIAKEQKDGVFVNFKPLSQKQRDEVYVELVKRLKLQESVVTEAEVKSDEDFKEYAETVLKKAFGEDYDENKAGEVIDGLISKYSGDYGAMVGALQSSLD